MQAVAFGCFPVDYVFKLGEVCGSSTKEFFFEYDLQNFILWHEFSFLSSFEFFSCYKQEPSYMCAFVLFAKSGGVSKGVEYLSNPQAGMLHTTLARSSLQVR